MVDETKGLALVTGATGFTGGRLAEVLVTRGYRVRAMVRDMGGTAATSLRALGIETVQGDLTDAGAIARAMEGVTHLFNIAAAYRDASHPDAYYFRVNRDGVRDLLAAAAKAGVARIVHCSTCGVHGDVMEIPANEETTFRPGDVYQRSKLEGEEIARAAMARGAPVSVVRPTGIYGPGDLRFLKLFRTVGNGTFRMFGDGEIAYHMTFIDDIVQGLILAAEHPAAVGEVFLIGDETYTTLNLLVAEVARVLDVPPPRGHLPVAPLMAAAVACEAICKPFGIDPPLHRRRVSFFTKARAFSVEKAKRTIGYQPQTSLAEGLRLTAAWYRETGRLAPAGRRRAA
ncbi:NAD-dependent epimerase/dehydratase family protein [uncultured Sulfitobacter sp.]|uniref:NAD-dependent epimerase/dehydratase family protein n=1 Tax=uncultured Sulfitobacter sp. TaxID=191468 RepID=UPI00261D5A9F|nr:NAD-dependent epimerase/dehydratase family protein [uncultured Sulfitobacter sp.]